MDEADKVVDMGASLSMRKPQQVVDAIRPGRFARGKVPLPRTNPCRALREAQAFLALFESHLFPVDLCAIEGTLQLPRQLVEVTGILDEITGRFEPEGAQHRLFAVLPCDQHYRSVKSFARVHLPEDFQRVRIGQSVVEQNHIVRAAGIRQSPQQFGASSYHVEEDVWRVLLEVSAGEFNVCVMTIGVEHSDCARRSVGPGVASQSVFQREGQPLQVVALGYIIIDARFERSYGRPLIAIAGNHNHCCRQSPRPHVSQERDYVSVRKSQVRQNDVKGPRIRPGEPSYGLALCCHHLQRKLWRVFAQRALHKLRIFGVVFHAKNLHGGYKKDRPNKAVAQCCGRWLKLRDNRLKRLRVQNLLQGLDETLVATIEESRPPSRTAIKQLQLPTSDLELRTEWLPTKTASPLERSSAP